MARAVVVILALLASFAPAFGQGERREEADPVDARPLPLRDAVAAATSPCPGPRCPARAANAQSSPLAGGPVRLLGQEPPLPGVHAAEAAAAKTAAPAKGGWLERLRRWMRRLLPD